MKLVIILAIAVLLALSVWLIVSAPSTPQKTNTNSASPPNATEPEPLDIETPPQESPPDPRVKALEQARKQAQKMLAEKYSVSNLSNMVRDETDDSKVLIALKQIRSRHPDKAEKAYMTLIGDDQLPIKKRAFAINALGELKAPSAVDNLKKIAGDKSNNLLALTAIGALSKCSDKGVIEFLKNLASKSESPEIRSKCRWSVKQIEASLDKR